MEKALPVLKHYKVPVSYVVLWVVLVVWSQTATRWPCLLVLCVVVAVTGLIGVGLHEARSMRRRAWLGQYLREDGRLFRLLRGGWLMKLVTMVTAVCLAALLLGQSLLWNAWLWGLLLLDVGLLYLMQHWFFARLVSDVKPAHRARVARLFALWTNVALLTVGIAVISVLTPQVDYRGVPLDAVLHQVSRQDAWTCQLVGVLDRLLLLNRELTHWLMQNVFDDFRAGGAVSLFAWVLVFVLSSAYSWAYSRLFLGMSSLLWTDSGDDGQADGR
ncbi:MAG: hypothetical protein JJT90_16015 [Ectothiorhodospiraceae bacterium]|nr:hypothetical protein [Ectothiorhodospiraceae bacterium]